MLRKAKSMTSDGRWMSPNRVQLVTSTTPSAPIVSRLEEVSLERGHAMRGPHHTVREHGGFVTRDQGLVIMTHYCYEIIVHLS